MRMLIERRRPSTFRCGASLRLASCCFMEEDSWQVHLQPPPRAHGFQNLGTSRSGLTFLCAAVPSSCLGSWNQSSDRVWPLTGLVFWTRFTSWFLKHSQALQSPGASAAIAVQASVDIASTECQHASNRRSVEAKSNQTHRQKLKHASANFVARSLRRTCSTRCAVKAPTHKQARKPGRKSSRVPKEGRSKYFPRCSDLRRGAGAWSIYVHERFQSLLTRKGRGQCCSANAILWDGKSRTGSGTLLAS